ncbi:MAG: hypothetical protein A2Y14_04475 [Verrucomicrobia bacterium GWF2_51_19]|nr:MAG: hypothetical protein A2Y14_04475 [Verrucomicrobia bacterium GWF2_51_19]HCJ12503.1 nucleotidyltransferase [Opitutae bacterium]
MDLDVSHLKRAIDTLDVALKVYEKTPNEFVRDSIIQRFEYTYDAAVKMIKKYLEMNVVSAEIQSLTFKELIRYAFEAEIIKDSVVQWDAYRLMRNKTTHAYDLMIANATCESIPQFLEAVQYLAKKLEERANR